MTSAASARDLTDAEQNRAVLELAAELLARGSAGALAAALDPPTVPAAGDGRAADPALASIAAEAEAVARSRAQLERIDAPLHLTVVWAMYGETGRIVPRSEHPHGEDFLREKVRQLDWLTDGLPHVTWSVIACDDGCPAEPSSSDLFAQIAAAEAYPTEGHRGVRLLRLADLIADDLPVSPAFNALTSTDQSRKGGSILAALTTAIAEGVPAAAPGSRHLVAYTDADLSSNLAQLGSLVAALHTGDGSIGALGQRYGMPGAVLVKPTGPMTEPHSTGDKPDKLIVLFRHYVRALLIPELSHVLDTQAGFKLFDAAAIRPALAQMTSFNETFDLELLIRLAHTHRASGLAARPMVFTEDFGATNFPSVDPGERHLAMVRQVVELYDALVAPSAPATGEAADLLDLLRGLDLAGYVRIIETLRAEDPGDPTLFERRWPVAHLRALLAA